MGCGDTCAHCGCGGERLTLVVLVVDAVFPWKRISTCRDAEKEFASDVVAWDYSVLRVKCSKFRCKRVHLLPNAQKGSEKDHQEPAEALTR